MITIRELTGNPAREIVEGRKRLLPVATVPMVDFRAPARAKFALEDIIPLRVPLNRHTARRKQSFTPYLELFRITNPGEFHTVEFFRHARAHGWAGERIVFNNLLQRRKRVGEVEAVRKDGKLVVWRFAPATTGTPKI